MNESLKNDINYKTAQSISSFLTELQSTIDNFHKKFDHAYEKYLDAFKNTNNDKNSTVSKKNIPGFKSFNKVTKIYEHVSKTLEKFISTFLYDYTDILNLALKINELKKKFSVLSDEYKYNANYLSLSEMYNLKKKLNNVVQEHNDLFVTFQSCNTQLEILKNSLMKGMLIYKSPKSGKKLTLSLNSELAEFNYHIELSSHSNYSEINNEYTKKFEERLKQLANGLTLLPITPLNHNINVNDKNNVGKENYEGTGEKRNFEGRVRNDNKSRMNFSKGKLKSNLAKLNNILNKNDKLTDKEVELLKNQLSSSNLIIKSMEDELMNINRKMKHMATESSKNVDFRELRLQLNERKKMAFKLLNNRRQFSEIIKQKLGITDN
ncbi:conserved uncharacterized protein 35a-like protein-11 [Microplitis demolitor]|uniref:probable kinetochore protein NDC80 n=1 Tax=Microplitis demolitor TaxID=69319 RepID=UPI00043FFE0D|nr:probable kinetochore protein NDC80 [Microplitis demolitor]KAG6558371.1 conserved uncharacterized protein 35a-like protein-11 [Microplitis demolitor]